MQQPKLFFKTKIKVALWFFALIPAAIVVVSVYVQFGKLDVEARSVNMLWSAFAGYLIAMVVSIFLVMLFSRRLREPIDLLGYEALRVGSNSNKSFAGENEEKILEVGADPHLRFIAFSINYLLKQLDYEKVRGAQLISDVSHELKTPITSILSSVEMLELEEEKLSDQSRQIFEILKKDVDYFSNLVLELLDLAKLENDAVQQNLEDINLKNWFEENTDRLVENIQRVIPDQKIIRPKLTLSEEVVLAAPIVFERIINNLLLNAYVHGKSCKEISVSKKANEVWIEIIDEGEGIAPGDEEKIFQRFYRGKAQGDRGRVKGTGLGLAIVSSFANLLGGRVWAYNKTTNDGACFVLTLTAK